ncbi:hypothetical protein DW191_04245 [Parabacteroides merdae]|uniref:Uncharacterized protein n=1 Tax=Parabacteroides merdae TaxID=46503 RepID=A0A3R6HP45_9BACT|nr:hypothetical protein DW191_04245 [Parabacteroides merdae]
MTEWLSSLYRQGYGRQAGFIRMPAIPLSFPEKRLFAATAEAQLPVLPQCAAGNLGYFFQPV